MSNCLELSHGHPKTCPEPAVEQFQLFSEEVRILHNLQCPVKTFTFFCVCVFLLQTSKQGLVHLNILHFRAFSLSHVQCVKALKEEQKWHHRFFFVSGKDVFTPN